MASNAIYEYDDLHHLTRVERDDGTVIRYEYDELGNRVRKAVDSPLGPSATATDTRTRTATPISTTTGTQTATQAPSATTATPSPTATLTVTGVPSATPIGSRPPSPTLAPTATAAPTPTRARGTAWVAIGSTTGVPGRQVSFGVTLWTGGLRVVSVQNDIAFDPRVPVAATEDGLPACAVNPIIGKGGVFAFYPRECAPGVDCTTARAVVHSVENLDPIPDGAALYTCQVRIPAGAAAGGYALGNAEVIASDAGGDRVPVDGSDGEIMVVEGAAVSIDVGSAEGDGGQQTSFDVTLSVLDPSGAGVAATENVVTFDTRTAVVSHADGSPDCQVNPGIGKGGTSFGFLPPDCTPGSGCNAIRALVLALDNSDPIPQGARLYNCRVRVSRGTPAGTYPLVISEIGASDTAGDWLAAVGTDGAVRVADGCPGDCDSDGRVTIGELVHGVNITLGGATLDSCRVSDRNGDGRVTIDELMRAINAALNGCG